MEARKWSGKWEAGPRGVVPPNAGSTLIAQVSFDGGEETWPPPREKREVDIVIGCRGKHSRKLTVSTGDVHEMHRQR